MKLAVLVPAYLRHREVIGRAPRTVEVERQRLKRFLAYLEAENVTEVEGLTRELVRGYVEELAECPAARGGKLATATRMVTLIAARGFLRWLYERDYVAVDHSGMLTLPRMGKPLPRDVLTAEEVRRLIRSPDLTTVLGVRDRAVLEVLWSTGIRVSELCGLEVADVDLAAGYVTVRKGKGGKDRVVPIGAVAAETVRHYLEVARPRMAHAVSGSWLFLTLKGKRHLRETIGALVRGHGKRSGIGKRVTPHVLRASCATAMLRNGAHPRHLQEMLGHASLETLERYTRLTVGDLKEAHTRFHPRERTE